MSRSDEIAVDTMAIEELVWHHSQVPLAKLFQGEAIWCVRIWGSIRTLNCVTANVLRVTFKSVKMDDWSSATGGHVLQSVDSV